jgi:hypothetical protein
MRYKKGDEVIRILPPSENWWAFVSEGHVIEADEQEVVCEVWVDVPRRMTFKQSNGICTAGTGSFIIRKIND